MKKLLVVAVLWSLVSAAYAVDVNVGYYFTDIFSKTPKLSMYSHYDNTVKTVESTLVRTTTFMSVCIVIDTQQTIASNDRGIVIKASNGDSAYDTWWKVPYTAESSVQKFCLNTTKFSYDLTVYWESLLESDSLLDKNSVNFKINRELKQGLGVKQVQLNMPANPKAKVKKAALSPQLFQSAVQCSEAFCVDHGFAAPGMGKGISFDKTMKQLTVRFGETIPAEWFNADTTGATHLCMRSNAAGWSGMKKYCVPVIFNKGMIIDMPVDGNSVIINEPFTFTLETPTGSVWSNNDNLAPFANGLVRDGDNFKVAP